MDDRTLYRVTLHRSAPRITDVEAALRGELQGCVGLVPAGGRVAVAVGSRGIANLALITRVVCGFLREQGAFPFVVPAMGSHGGATGPGQAAVLAGYGVTEESVNAPVISSMETVELARGELPCRLFMDRQAFGADGVVLLNRIKPHTDFNGDYESGLVKMAVIGLGNQDQAAEIHSFGARGLMTLLAPAARRLIDTGRILFGVGIVEDAWDRTALLRAIPSGAILEEERSLLVQAREMMARLPVEALDLLVVDQMGKDISGTGMDTNIIGRLMVEGLEEPASPQIDLIIADDLTPGAHGNALGVGLADIITRKLHSKIDCAATYENTLTTSFLRRSKIPLVAENAAAALSMAMRARSRLTFEAARTIRIRSTLHLGELMVSRPVMESLRERADLTIAPTPLPLFDPSGNLSSWD